eukprot:2504366-Amphidinium_carterae.1
MLGFGEAEEERGKPSRQQLWRDALFSATLGNEFDKAEQIQSKDVPVWWNKGQNIVQAEEDVATVLAILDEQIIVEGVAEVVDTAVPEGEQAAKNRRKKMEVSRDAQIWFLRWSEHRMTTSSEWAPDVFGGAHADTPRRCLLPEKVEENEDVARGRPAKISAPFAQILATVVLDIIHQGIAASAIIYHLQHIASEALEKPRSQIS